MNKTHKMTQLLHSSTQFSSIEGEENVWPEVGG